MEGEKEQLKYNYKQPTQAKEGTNGNNNFKWS